MKWYKKLKVLWYINEIDAATAEYFYLKNLEDIMIFKIMWGEVTKSSYDRVSDRVKYLKTKRVKLIVKVMELEIGK